MKNMKISAKLTVSFLILILLASAVGIFGIVGMIRISSASTDMYYQKTVPLPYVGKAEENLSAADHMNP